jgi:cupin 2 domain-containing protein
LLKRRGVLLERIVSFGQRTPPGTWLKEKKGEWVVLLSGSATLSFWKKKPVNLKPGDHMFIPANTPHRVERTHVKNPTIWLALHLLWLLLVVPIAQAADWDGVTPHQPVAPGEAVYRQGMVVDLNNNAVESGLPFTISVIYRGIRDGEMLFEWEKVEGLERVPVHAGVRIYPTRQAIFNSRELSAKLLLTLQDDDRVTVKKLGADTGFLAECEKQYGRQSFIEGE